MVTAYRFMRKGEETRICALVKKVFDEFVAPDYSDEGVGEFYTFANTEAIAARAGENGFIMVAEDGDDLTGMIEIVRGDHISLLFVDRRCEGIGKTLVAMAVDECLRIKPELKSITVNSSPFAVPAYEKMGFRAVGPFREVNGIIFIPMERPVN